MVNSFLINAIYSLHHDVYSKLPFDLRGGARICINRGGISPLGITKIPVNFLCFVDLIFFLLERTSFFDQNLLLIVEFARFQRSSSCLFVFNFSFSRNLKFFVYTRIRLSSLCFVIFLIRFIY